MKFILSGNLHRRELATQSFGAWLLCALLLLLCANARLARYEIHQRILRLATTQAYVDGIETLRKLPKAPPPLLGQAEVVAFAVTTPLAASLEVSVSETVAFEGFDPESCLRSPPIQ